MRYKKLSPNYWLMIRCVLVMISVSAAVSSAATLELREIAPGQAKSQYFRVETATRLFIDVVLGVLPDTDKRLADAWIVDRHGELVWKIEKITSRGKLASCKADLILQPGYYKACYFMTPRKEESGRHWLYSWLFRKSDTHESSEKWGIKLEADSIEQLSADDFYDRASLIADMSQMVDNQFRTRGITVLKQAPMEIYAIGEGDPKKRVMYDYGWIQKADSRELIWKMQVQNTVHAGGANKNLLARDSFTFEPGNYLISFITDDSHSFESWNDFPPFDLDAWGIRLRYSGDQPLDSVVTSYQEYRSTPLVDLTKVTDNQCLVAGILLRQNSRLYVRAVGEYSISRKKFVDHGWIMNASTRETVWSMTYENTMHAGGGTKNRMFDNYIDLDAGKYLVFYATDSDHAYGAWNERPPGVEYWWGITIYSKDAQSESFISPYEEARDSLILAQIIKVGDKSKRTKRMVISDTTLVRIYAVGEGDKHSMYDYGWIEDEDANLVWVMTHKNSSDAGGAQKNRLVNDLLQLHPGSYRVFYQSDDSHSYEKWNDLPPDDQIHWGITVIELSD